MSSDRDSDVRRLFAEAMAHDAEERSVWLAQACDDPEVRREVASLIEAAMARGRDVEEALERLPRLGDVHEALRSGEPSARHLSGQRIAHYQMLGPLGQGGMGIVYKALDTQLGRPVAIKFLPAELTHDPESRQRFLQEAQAASALDHPAVCTVYEINDDATRPFIAMALVEGETLRERIGRRPLPLADAVDVATQVAGGLAAAHQRGIVHRDIKPANVMVTGEGRAKILDFGLAKMLGVSLSRTGSTLGTVRYMSPEQVRGEAVDPRTDIWALGVLLYETLTGQPPFQGERAESVMHAILHDDPEPMTALRSGIPVALDDVVAKALAKDPADRYQHVDEIPVDLRRALERPSGSMAWTRRPLRRGAAAWSRPVLAAALVTLLLAAVAVVASNVWRDRGGSGAPVRFDVVLPLGQDLSSWRQPLALSPDGRRIAYGARRGDDRRIYLRDLASFETTSVAGTEGGIDPFFSPDGRSLGFFAHGELKRVDLDGGIPQAICDARQQVYSASWGPDDTILLTLGIGSGVLRVPASGGIPEALTVPDRAAGEIAHGWPFRLPDGRGVVFTIWSAEGMKTAVLSLDTGEWRTVHEGSAAGRYVATGHLVFAQMAMSDAEPALLAVPFDLARAEVRGAPVSVIENPGIAGPNFAVSENGTLVYVAAGSRAWAKLDENTLVWRHGDGRETPALEHPGVFNAPHLASDGARIAVGDYSPSGSYDVWVHEPDRGTRTRVSLHGPVNTFPVWTPDGQRVAFATGRAPPGIVQRLVDGSGPVEQLTTRGQYPQLPGSWSPDGAVLAFTQLGAQGGGDIWIRSLDGETEAVVATPASETAPAFSPDGALLAYASDATGRYEVYVREYPGPGATVLLSTDGGREPVWAPNGNTLYYRGPDALMAVAVTTDPRLTAGRPRRLFDDDYQHTDFDQTNYDVAADGRFLMVRGVEPVTPTRLNVVLNWLDELEARVPSGR